MTAALDEKLQALGTITRAPAALDRFGAFLREADDWDLLRINPMRLAERQGIDPWEVVDLLVCGVRVGLFDLEWTTICPVCSGIGHAATSIAELDAQGVRCALCDRDIATVLDERVEVSFTISPTVHRLAIDPLANPETFQRYWFSDNVVVPEEVLARVGRATRAWEVVQPGDAVTVSTDVVPGTYRLVSVQRNALHRLRVEGDATGAGDGAAVVHTESVVRLTPRGFEPEEGTATPGRLTLQVHNDTDEALVLIFAEVDPEVGCIVDRGPLPARPFLTGLDLLNTQSFRDHFTIQALVPGLRLRVRSLVVLFTDLKDSTALYDRTGDVSAYDFVRDHFEILTGCVRDHHGAVVKTMGDAVMATFGSPADAARAAIEMVRRVDALCRRRETPARLKVGAHGGPALVISADSRLDYFGQTVNTAARVQALAGGGQVCLTRELHAAPGVAEVFAADGFVASFESASLKGIADPTEVVRLSSSASAAPPR